MNKIKQYDRVVLTQDLVGTILKSGDVGTIVEVYNKGEAYEIEFCTLDGSTLAVETVTANLVRPTSGKMVLHVRDLAA